MHTIQLSTSLHKQIRKLPPKSQSHFYETVSKLQVNPFQGKKLKGELSGSYSLRLWPYRILYSVDKKNKIVMVHTVEHRQDVYR